MLCSVFDGTARSSARDGCGTEDIARLTSHERRARRMMPVAGSRLGSGRDAKVCRRPDAPPSRGSPWTFALLPTSLPATSSCRATRPGTPRGRPGTWPSTSGPSPSSIPSRRTTSRDRALRRRARICASRSTPAATTRARSTGRGTPCSSRRSACAGSRSTPAAAARTRRGRGARRSPSRIAAGEHGLAYLAGTSPDVGVLGYALGGGLSWMVRSARPGLQHASWQRTWSRPTAGRPGRPRHGAGAVLGAARWQRQRGRRDGAGARAVPGRRDLRRRDVLADRARDGDPERLARVDRDRPRRRASHSGGCSSCRTSRSCPMQVRGRSFVLIEVAFIGSAADGAALLQPLRDLGAGDRQRGDDAAAAS